MLKNKLSNTLVNISILVNVCIIFIPSKFKIYPILLFLLSAIYFKFKSVNNSKFSFGKILLISGLIFIYSLSNLFSKTSTDVFYKLSTMASLVAYPIIFALLESSRFVISTKNTRNTYNLYVIALVLFPIISFFYLFKMKFTFAETIIHYSNLINIQLNNFSIHPIYLSIYIAIAVLFLVELIKNTNLKTLKITYIVTSIFLFIVLAILMRRGPIIYLFITLIVLFYSYFKLKKTVLSFSILMLVLAISIYVIPKYKNENRFNDLINNAFVNKTESSVGIRFNIYNCAVQKIGESPYFGYGLDNVQNELDSCYLNKKIDISSINYNSHNQYFSILLTAGIFGFVLYLFTLYKTFKILNQKKSILGLSLFIFFLLNFLTENVLERENGVILYSFFMSYFLFQNEESLIES